MRWVLGASFIAMAIWIMVPDKIDDDETSVGEKLGVFGATVVSFFLAEMGDKTRSLQWRWRQIQQRDPGVARHHARHDVG